MTNNVFVSSDITITDFTGDTYSLPAPLCGDWYKCVDNVYNFKEMNLHVSFSNKTIFFKIIFIAKDNLCLHVSFDENRHICIFQSKTIQGVFFNMTNAIQIWGCTIREMKIHKQLEEKLNDVLGSN